MNGQLKVRFITAITIALATLFTTIVINQIAVNGSNEELAATDLEVLWQLARVADKYTGETLSYAYYVELNAEFNQDAYSDEPAEQWSVPSWFKYPPPGLATCRSVDGKMGCVVWNLDGTGTDDKHPCPEIKAYSPNPAVSTTHVLKPINIANVETNQIQAFQEANKMLAEGTSTGGTLYGLSLFGKSVSIAPAVSVSALNPNKTEIKSSGTVDVRLKDSLGDWNLEVNRTVDTEHILTASIGTREKTAYCICREKLPGGSLSDPKVLGRYRVEEYYVQIITENNSTGETIVEGNIPYIKYFKDWDYKPVYDGSTEYDECELIVP